MKREYLSKKDLQVYLKISPATVGRLMLEGIPHVKLKRRVLFRLDLVDGWLEAKMKGQPAPARKRRTA
jgi:hypothetical protein